MAPTKRKTVFTAEPRQWARIQEAVGQGRYRTASEFLREAIDEKLERLERAELSEQVEDYCARGHLAEDGELVGSQAFDPDE